MNPHAEPGADQLGADQPGTEQPGTEQPGTEQPHTPQPGPVQAAAPDRTGHATVDAALAAVSEVAGAAPADQLPAYQAAHRTLRETLASIDEG